MVAANPLSRLLLLAAALTAVVGCRSDAPAVIPRGQIPQDPLGPVAPPRPPELPAQGSPLAPAAPVAPPGASPTVSGAVAGSPVTGDDGQVINTGFKGVKAVATAAELLKNGTPRVKVVAIVGANNVITDQEVRESVWQQNDELAKLSGRAREEKQQELYTVALRRIIERELILDEMYTKLRKAGKLAVAEELRDTASTMADRQIREIKKRTMSKTDEEFAAFLRLQGLTLPVLRRQFERQIMAQQYLNSMFRDKIRRPGLGEIRDYYDHHPREFQAPDRVKWQHLFVSAGRHPSAEAASRHAEGLREKIAAGADFAALAKQFDDGLAGKQNGFGTGETRGNILPLDLEPTVWSLKPGEISGVIPTPTGYHIVKVVERDFAGVQPFDAKVQAKIRDKLTDTMTEAETKKLVENLWRRNAVRVLDE